MKKLIIIIIIAIGLAITFYFTVEPKREVTEESNTNIVVNKSVVEVNKNINSTAKSEIVRWDDFGDGYVSDKTPPNCLEPLLLQTPVDLSQVVNILYPGQERGGDFKPHGGFRFADGTDEDILVTIPMDGWLLEGARYYENGHLQYMFGFLNSCGIMYRFDHLYTLSDKLKELADTLPEPKENDTRTTRYSDVTQFTVGEVIATKVGEGDNVFVDWGVYDIRQKNGVLIDQFDSLTEYGVCWFGLLNTEDEAMVRSLPAGDSTSGSYSEYCS
jgi:hypothetical protein